MTREHIKTSMTELENITKETCNDAQSQTPKTMQNATQTQMQNSTRKRREGNTRNDTFEIFDVDERRMGGPRSFETSTWYQCIPLAAGTLQSSNLSLEPLSPSSLAKLFQDTNGVNK